MNTLDVTCFEPKQEGQSDNKLNFDTECWGQTIKLNIYMFYVKCCT